MEKFSYNLNCPIVAKFGGSSNAIGERVLSNVEIMRADPRRRYMINSAPGKDPLFQKDSGMVNNKITDWLKDCHNKALNGESYEQELEEIERRYVQIAGVLQVTTVHDYLDRLRRGIPNGDGNWTEAQGEWIQNMLISDYTGWPFKDPIHFIKLRNNGEISPMTYELIKNQLLEDTIYVIPGYYGSDEAGNVKVFKRGGGDITGAIVARGVNGSLYENWTDVNGFSAADPRIVKDFMRVDVITRSEVRELSYRGANVFHGDAVLPLVGTDIDIHLLNSLKPSEAGTRIVRTRGSSAGEGAIGIAGKSGFRAFTLVKPGMNNEEGIGRKIFTILNEFDILYDHDITGIDYMSIIIDEDQFEKNGHQIKSAMDIIKKTVGIEDIDEEKNIGLVCLVGQNLPNALGIRGKAISAMETAGIDILAINSPVKGKSMTIAVRPHHVNAAIRVLYERLFKDGRKAA